MAPPYDPLRSPFDAPLLTLDLALDLARPLTFGRVAGHSLATATRGAFDRALLTTACAALPDVSCPRDGAPCARPDACVIPWLHKPAAAAQRRTHPSPAVLHAAPTDDPRRVALSVALFGRHAVDAVENVLAALHLAAAWGVRDDEGAVRFALRGDVRDARTLAERAASLRDEAPPGARWSLEFVDPCAAEAPELAALAGNAAHDLVQWDLHDRGDDEALGKRGCDALADLARAAAQAAWGAVEVTIETLSADTWGPRRSRSNAGRFALEGFRGTVRLEGAVREALPWIVPWTLRGLGGRTAWGMGVVRLTWSAP